jgi:hypothetical protein
MRRELVQAAAVGVDLLAQARLVVLQQVVRVLEQ